MALNLEEIKVYIEVRKLSAVAWKIFSDLTWQIKKILGDQFIQSTDSVGGNIAEGYGRFHYLDRIKFFYNARGSLLESKHWFELLDERSFLKNKELKNEYKYIYENLKPQLNSFINAIFKNKSKK